MKVGDVVRVKRGYFEGKEGTICFIHIYRVLKAGKRWDYAVIRFKDGQVEEVEDEDLKFIKHKKLSAAENKIYKELKEEEEVDKKEEAEFDKKMNLIFVWPIVAVCVVVAISFIVRTIFH